MTQNGMPGADVVSVSIARQPVFDDKSRLWGYELFCLRSSGGGYSGLPEASVAVSIESSAYISLQQILNSRKRIIVDFSEKSILDRLPYALPPGLSAICIHENACRQPAVIEAIQRLKSDGYVIAIGGFSGAASGEAAYALADILAIETSSRTNQDILGAVRAAQPYSASLLATRIPDRELHGWCRGVGFTLFHGVFFKSPETITIRRLSSNEALRLELLRMIESPEQDSSVLAETIQTDATISFRLLAYLNSAAFSFSQKIKSIRQAVALLGWNMVKGWLRVVLLSDVSQSKDARELVLLSAQRGMFLEGVATAHDFWGFEPDSLHLLGIFSLLDSLLQMPMTEIVTHLPLDGKMKAALCRQPENEYLPLLELAQYMEEARWPEAESLMQRLNLDAVKVSAAFRKSVNWASELELALPPR